MSYEIMGRVFAKHLPSGRILTEDTNFFEAGLTSIRLAAILDALVAAGIEVSMVDLFRFPTLRQLRAQSPWRPDPAPAQQRRPMPWER